MAFSLKFFGFVKRHSDLKHITIVATFSIITSKEDIFS
jgi:hypothetical protein